MMAQLVSTIADQVDHQVTDPATRQVVLGALRSAIETLEEEAA